jgi:hypothetical protein
MTPFILATRTPDAPPPPRPEPAGAAGIVWGVNPLRSVADYCSKDRLEPLEGYLDELSRPAIQSCSLY